MIHLKTALILAALSLVSVANATPLPNFDFGKGLNTTLRMLRDTIDPEQRLPEGVKKPVPARISTAATTEPFETRLDPASWYVDFSEPMVELMIHDKGIREFAVTTKHKGLKIKKVDRPQNPNYLFVTVEVSKSAALGDAEILVAKGNDKRTFKWHLERRRRIGGKGLTTKDFVYLIMPDRFANGDPTNDSFNELTQQGVDRRKMYFRHGGDLQGIMDKLDYLQELGVTALWLNPVQENDEPYESYHGYAMTDIYRVDRRFGGNKKYIELADKMRSRGMKLVMDVAPNHVGHNNFFIKDLPESTWIHQFDTFSRTNYRDQVGIDPYASEADKKQMLNGWFDYHMPDLNPETNKHLETQLTQSYMWWLEAAGIDALRIDTYLYNDPQFMKRWAEKIRKEFPKVTLFGETWVTGTLNQAYSTEGFAPKAFDSKLHGTTDFQLYNAITESLTKPQGWMEGVMQMYQNLSNDMLYKNPYQNVIFFDNHDISRFFSVVNEDMDKYKSAIAWLMTCRGIPQWYYGAELGFTGYTNPDGKVRQDMPGGWKEDEKSVFTEGGRSDREKEIFNYTKKLANWRKSKTCLHDGKLMQFIPIDGIYTYFRYSNSESIMVVMNTSDKAKTVDLSRFKERLKGFSKGKNVATDAMVSDLNKLEVGKFQTVVLDLVK
jgi:neopullulanase